MYDMKNMDEIIKPFCSGERIFDLYRLVDPYTHEVFNYDHNREEKFLKHSALCFQIWHRDSPCVNCISMRSCKDHKQYVKVESLAEEALLVVSVPFNLCNRMFALEMVKFVTDSMVVASEYHGSNVEIGKFINELNDLAVKDPFTGLFNKVFVQNELENFVQAHKGENALLTGVGIDIDNFKNVNDEYGHSVGDVVIKHISAVIKKTSNKYEGWAGRVGGDEFVMFFKNKTHQEVGHICKDMSEKIRKFSYKKQKDNFNVTISFGIEELQEGDNVEKFLNKIDQAMYRQKKKQNKKAVTKSK